MQEMNDKPVFFDDRSTSRIETILASIRMMKIKYGIKGAVVDYLQILDENSNGLNEKIRKYYRHEESLIPLRISRNTVILVKPEKCNEEYAEKYRKEKLGI